MCNQNRYPYCQFVKSGSVPPRACLKIGDVPGGENLGPLASNLFAGLLTDFREKLRRPAVKRPVDWAC
ncbi:hypothetical protein ADH75_05260 [Flavonifractor plautii]|nr:hypothetical protein A4U99_18565 [Flavonifractor plautii]OXE49529.1 hypothetical protein ADH75_05260 [Flavonifractor plautii]